MWEGGSVSIGLMLVWNVCLADSAKAVIQCVIREKETGEMLALAEHGKSALADQTFPVVGNGGARSSNL